MAHSDIKKLLAAGLAVLLTASLAACKVTVEDGGYQSGKIVDELTEPTEETTLPGDEQVMVSTDGAIGQIVGGEADVYDEPDGKVIATLDEGTKVITIERTVDWVHIEQGWVKAEFVSLEPLDVEDTEGIAGFVNADQVNVRSGPGTDNSLVGKVTRNDLLLITETEEDDDKLKWGKFDRGWVCMTYVTTDLFGVDVLVLQDKTQEMGMAGEGGVITEHDYGTWFTVRAVQVVDGVIWGKIGDGWIDLSKTALSTYDAKKLEGVWRSYESYDSKTFFADGTFSFATEDYELKGDSLVKKGEFSTKEGCYIYDGKDLKLYYTTVNGKKTDTSVHDETLSLSFSGGDIIWDGDSKNPLIKDLTPQQIYDEKYKPKSDPDAVAWISGSWLYFSSCATAEDGSKTALGNLLTIGSDGSFSVTAYTFKSQVGEDGTPVWSATAGSTANGTYIYDGTDMIMTCGSTLTVKMPKNSEASDLIAASGLEQIMYSGAPDGTVGQTMRRAAATDDASLCSLVATIFV